jgi:hypothetical protein
VKPTLIPASQRPQLTANKLQLSKQSADRGMGVAFEQGEYGRYLVQLDRVFLSGYS